MTDPAVGVIIIISMFVLFAVSHSLLASSKLKQLLATQLGDLFSFYRLFYNIVSLVIIYLIYKYSPRPDVVIYDLSSPYDILILVPQFLSLFGIFWSLNYFCAKEFLGIEQVKRFINKTYSPDELDEIYTLNINGPYRYIRHPLYFFSFTFLLFRPTMDLFYLTFIFCSSAYFYIGSFFEEKKLVEKFGDIYIDYRRTVPRFIPFKLFQPYKKEEINV